MESKYSFIFNFSKAGKWRGAVLADGYNRPTVASAPMDFSCEVRWISKEDSFTSRENRQTLHNSLFTIDNSAIVKRPEDIYLSISNGQKPIINNDRGICYLIDH